MFYSLVRTESIFPSLPPHSPSLHARRVTDLAILITLHSLSLRPGHRGERVLWQKTQCNLLEWNHKWTLEHSSAGF